KEVLWSSMVKDTMKRKRPSFNESYHGYRSFSELLEDAQKEGLVELDKDKRSLTYVVSRFGEEMKNPPPAPPKAKSARRRKRRGGARGEASTGGKQLPLLRHQPRPRSPRRPRRQAGCPRGRAMRTSPSRVSQPVDPMRRRPPRQRRRSRIERRSLPFVVSVNY